MLSAGPRGPAIVDAAVEQVVRTCGRAFRDEDLLGDAIDPLLQVRLRGDLLLVAEDLTEEGRSFLIAGLRTLAATDPTPERTAIVDTCEQLLTGNARTAKPNRRFGRPR